MINRRLVQLGSSMIGVDWGITHLRAYRIGPGGAVIEARDEAKGIMAVTHAAFEGTLETVIGDWLDGEPEPFLMSGMIGSRQGWVEAQYVECPAHPVDIARALAPVTCAGRPGFICPGLTCRDIDGVPDVMRGEEVQIFGALALLPVGVLGNMSSGDSQQTHCDRGRDCRALHHVYDGGDVRGVERSQYSRTHYGKGNRRLAGL